MLTHLQTIAKFVAEYLTGFLFPQTFELTFCFVSSVTAQRQDALGEL